MIILISFGKNVVLGGYILILSNLFKVFIPNKVNSFLQVLAVALFNRFQSHIQL